MTTRRRENNISPLMEPKSSLSSGFNIPSAISLVTGRRRRLFMYLAAFSGMLAFSSLLDLRKDPIYNWIQKERGVTISSKLKPIVYPATVSSEDETSPKDSSSSSSESARLKPETEMSEQELKDAVDQFISHVEEETTANQTENQANVVSNDYTTKTKITNSSSSGKVFHSPIRTGSTNMTIEEQFEEARRALDKAIGSKALRAHMDEQELRTLRALELQAIRGDCEKSVDHSAGNGLFKSDAEAAADEIEKTDALWGAWCVFSGRYQSDAMREYLSASYTFRERVAAQAEVGHAAEVLFDENAASIDEVIAPESLQKLQDRSKFIKPHLTDGDIRLLSAIALQAMYGDCIPYAKVEQEEGKEYRKLEDPIFGEVAKRKEGDLWGAWCVFSKTSRVKAVQILSSRIESFWEQLQIQTKVSTLSEEESVDEHDSR